MLLNVVDVDAVAEADSGKGPLLHNVVELLLMLTLLQKKTLMDWYGHDVQLIILLTCC